MIRFIHTADVHYGMENYGRVDPTTGIHSRLLDFHASFNKCIDAAIEHKVDFFLFSGDAYKTTTPSPTQQKLMLKSLLRLYEHNIPVIIVIGNHDNPLSFGKAHSLDIFSELPLEGFHVIAKPSIINLTTASGPVNIVGIPWPTRNMIALNAKHTHTSASEITSYIAESVAHIISQLALQLDPEIPAVLAGHLTVSSGIFSGSEKRAIYGTDPIFMPSMLAIPPFDYVGLGHLHRYQNLNPDGYPAIVYSGSIDRIDFGERKEDKGFCLVTIEKKGVTRHEFIQVPVRPFIQIEVTLDSNSGQTEQIIQAIKRQSLQDAVVKIVYHVPADQPDTVNTAALERACQDAWYLVGIVPVRTVSTRQRRMGASVDMDLATLLEHYFASRPELTHKKQHLIEEILQLKHELELEEIHEEGQH